MLHQSEGLPPHPTWTAYSVEESRFLDAIRKVFVQEVPKNSNVITSHFI